MEAKTTSAAVRISDMTAIGMMTAVTCILGPVAVPIGVSPVPISLATLILYLSIYLLKTKKALISCVVYLLIGIAGLPVFSGFSGGLGKAAGPTGGYLLGYLFLIAISGIFLERWPRSRWLQAAGLALGTAACYLFGTVWLAGQMNLDLAAGLSMGVLPYLPGDAVKIAAAVAVGPAAAGRVRRAVKQDG